MSRKFYFSFILIGAILAIGHITSFAQYAPVSGTVEVQKKDGTREPVVGALIEVYRIDVKSGSPPAKTGKKGEFGFAGLQLGGVYAFSISAPNCAPTVFPGVKAGQEKLVLTLSPGDGSQLTEAEARTAAAKTPTTNFETEEEKKARAKFEKENADVEAKNAKMKNADETARKMNEEGAAALKANDFDLAITKYGEGIAAVPDYIGSTPILLSGKIIALKGKAFKLYREGAATGDFAIRQPKYAEANKYYDEALESFQQALDIIKKAPAAADAAEQKRRAVMVSDLYSLAIEIHRLKAAGGVDTSKANEAGAMVADFMVIESDPARKLTAQMALGDIMRLTGDFPKAIEAYKRVLEMKPDYPDALGSLGLTLFAQGAAATPEDKAMEQEGLNIMQKYTEVAPVLPTDSQSVKDLKISVKETVEYLKSQKMTPQKVPAAPKKKP